MPSEAGLHVLTEFPVEPGPCKVPVAFYGCRRDIQHFCGFLNGQPPEKAAFDDLVLPFAEGGQPSERFVKRQDLLRLLLRQEKGLVEGKMRLSPAPFLCLAPQGITDQDVAHRLGCYREEMGAALVLHTVQADQLEVGFMYQRCGVERMPVSLAAEAVARHTTQLIIYKRKQRIEGRRITFCESHQQPGNFLLTAHPYDVLVRGSTLKVSLPNS